MCVCVSVRVTHDPVGLADAGSVSQLMGYDAAAGTDQLKLTYWLHAVPVTLTLRDPEQVDWFMLHEAIAIISDML